jgi:hypothetical protein
VIRSRSFLFCSSFEFERKALNTFSGHAALTARDNKGICNLLLTWVHDVPLGSLTCPAIACALACTTSHTAPEKSLYAALAVLKKMHKLGPPTPSDANTELGHTPADSRLTAALAGELVRACSNTVTTKAVQMIAGNHGAVHSLLEVLESNSSVDVAPEGEFGDACAYCRFALTRINSFLSSS